MTHLPLRRITPTLDQEKWATWNRDPPRRGGKKPTPGGAHPPRRRITPTLDQEKWATWNRYTPSAWRPSHPKI